MIQLVVDQFEPALDIVPVEVIKPGSGDDVLVLISGEASSAEPGWRM